MAGETTSIAFPTAGNGVDTSCGTDGLCNASDPYHPFTDGFVAQLSADLSRIDFATYLGGSGNDYPTVVALDGAGRAYAAGYTDSVDLPTHEGAFDRTYNGGTSDAFISLFDTDIGGAGGGMIFTNDLELGDLSGWQ